MCCDDYTPGDKQDKRLKLMCVECRQPVDKDGDTLLSCCGYSPVQCKKCGWKPCDQSC